MRDDVQAQLRPLAALAAVAETQYGLVTTAQALEALGKSRLRRELERGGLVRVGRRVLRFAGARPSWRQRAMAACLAYGAPVAVSHLAAAYLYQLEGIAAPAPEVTVPASRSGRVPGVRTHRARLDPTDVSVRHHIPVTDPARTFVDVGGLLHPVALGRALDDALRRKLVRIAELMDELERTRSLKADGAGQLRMLAQLRADVGVGDSHGEDEVLGWLLEAGFPPPVRQYEVEIGGVIRFIDLAWPEPMVAVEYMGFDPHGRRQRFDADQERTTELGLGGWLVVLVSSSTPRADVLDRTGRALRQRGVSF